MERTQEYVNAALRYEGSFEAEDVADELYLMQLYDSRHAKPRENANA